MTHRWTDEDDAALRVAVEACLPMQDTMRGGREIWWAAVCGRLGLIDVSPDAARTRWQRLRQGDTLETTEAWERVAEKVEQYEQSLLEAAVEDIADLRAKVNEMYEWFGPGGIWFRDVRDGIAYIVRQWEG